MDADAGSARRGLRQMHAEADPSVSAGARAGAGWLRRTGLIMNGACLILEIETSDDAVGILLVAVPCLRTGTSRTGQAPVRPGH